MATKKQKRERALAKREEFMAKVKAEGLAALQRDREHQAKIDELFSRHAEQINARHREILNQHGIKPGTSVAYDAMTRE